MLQQVIEHDFVSDIDNQLNQVIPTSPESCHRFGWTVLPIALACSNSTRM